MNREPITVRDIAEGVCAAIVFVMLAAVFIVVVAS